MYEPYGELSIPSLTQTTSVTRRCRERHYGLAPHALDSARDYLDAIARHWDQALLRLKAHVEAK